MIQSITLSKYDWNLATYHAGKAEVGGVSRVRSTADRTATLVEDQLVGQLGTIALHKYLYGTTERYILSRHVQNQFPDVGDGGEDLPGANVDVKTSVMRYGQNPYAYNLCVRPRERHPDWVYLLALVPNDYVVNRVVQLVGWTLDANLPDVVRADGPLAGAYVVSAADLLPLPPIQYRWFQ